MVSSPNTDDRHHRRTASSSVSPPRTKSPMAAKTTPPTTPGNKRDATPQHAQQRGRERELERDQQQTPPKPFTISIPTPSGRDDRQNSDSITTTTSSTTSATTTPTTNSDSSSDNTCPPHPIHHQNSTTAVRRKGPVKVRVRTDERDGPKTTDTDHKTKVIPSSIAARKARAILHFWFPFIDFEDHHDTQSSSQLTPRTPPRSSSTASGTHGSRTSSPIRLAGSPKKGDRHDKDAHIPPFSPTQQQQQRPKLCSHGTQTPPPAIIRFPSFSMSIKREEEDEADEEGVTSESPSSKVLMLPSWIEWAILFVPLLLLIGSQLVSYVPTTGTLLSSSALDNLLLSSRLKTAASSTNTAFSNTEEVIQSQQLPQYQQQSISPIPWIPLENISTLLPSIDLIQIESFYHEGNHEGIDSKGFTTFRAVSDVDVHISEVFALFINPVDAKSILPNLQFIEKTSSLSYPANQNRTSNAYSEYMHESQDEVYYHFHNTESKSLFGMKARDALIERKFSFDDINRQVVLDMKSIKKQDQRQSGSTFVDVLQAKWTLISITDKENNECSAKKQSSFVSEMERFSRRSILQYWMWMNDWISSSTSHQKISTWSKPWLKDYQELLCERIYHHRNPHQSKTSSKCETIKPKTRMELEFVIDLKGMIPKWKMFQLQKHWPVKVMEAYQKRLFEHQIEPFGNLSCW